MWDKFLKNHKPTIETGPSLVTSRGSQNTFSQKQQDSIKKKIKHLIDTKFSGSSICTWVTEI